MADLSFRIRDSHTLWLNFPFHSTNSCQYRPQSEPQKYYYSWFGLFRVRSPLLAESRLISFPLPTQMFQFRRFPTQCYFIHKELTEYCSAGFPHSEIHGSLPAFDFPWLIVDRYVLHRLPMPRHPPCALFSLTFSELCVLMFVNFSTRLYCSIFTHLTIVKSFEYLLHYLVVSISHYLYSVFKVHLQAFRLVWWAQEDSNLRPHAYQACALTT